MTLWILSIVLLLLALAFVVYPFINKKKPADHAALLAANVAVFRDTEKLLNNQLTAGDIDQTQHQQLLAEAQQLLLANTEQIEVHKTSTTPVKTGTWILPVLLFSIPVMTFVAYDKLGASADQQIADLLRLQLAQTAALNTNAENGDAENGHVESGDVENAATEAAQQDYRQHYRELQQQLADQVAARVKERPENTYYWVILAQQATVKGDLQAASNHYRQALKVMPNDSYLLAQYAETLFMLASSEFTEPVTEALDKAFAVDSSNPTVLGLKGIQAFKNEQWQLAITFWQGALQQVDQNSYNAENLNKGIRLAEIKLQGSEQTANPENLSSNAPLQTIELRVSIDPNITFDPQQTVFVALVAISGPPMPLAARKLRAGDLPIQISLSDADAVMAGHSLSSAKEFKAIARLSQTGSATPQSGDWEVSSGPLKAGAQTGTVELRISIRRL